MTSTAIKHSQPVALLVDDDFSLRFLIAEALLQADFEVIEVENGQEAIDYLGQHHDVDIVLMDVQMPIMNGFQACQLIRKIPSGEHLPILMMTGLDDEASIEQAYESGATDFITKPIKLPLLVQRVRYMYRTGEMTNELVKSQQRLAEAQRLARIGYWEWHAEGNEVIWSPSALDILRFEDEQYQLSLGFGSGFGLFLNCIPESERTLITDLLKQACEGKGVTEMDHSFLPDSDKGAAALYFHHEMKTIYDDLGQVVSVYGSVQDVTSSYRAQKRIRELAYQDSLTGLPNRAYFHQLLARCIQSTLQREESGALLFIDLDDFKRINDPWGIVRGTYYSVRSMKGLVTVLLKKLYPMARI